MGLDISPKPAFGCVWISPSPPWNRMWVDDLESSMTLSHQMGIWLPPPWVHLNPDFIKIQGKESLELGLFKFSALGKFFFLLLLEIFTQFFVLAWIGYMFSVLQRESLIFFLRKIPLPPICTRHAGWNEPSDMSLLPPWVFRQAWTSFVGWLHL